MRDASDGELMRMIGEGNTRAFQEVYRRYSPNVLGYSRRLIRDARVSEEVSQEVWLKVVRAAASYRGEGTLKAWLYTVVRRTAFNYLRDHTHREEINVEAPEPAVTIDEFERQVLARAEMDAVRLAVDELPDNQRLALTLWLTEDLSYEDIGRELGVSEGVVKSLLHRARNGLAAKFGIKR